MDLGSIRARDPDGFKVPRLIAMLVGAALCGSPLPAHAQKNPLRDVFFGETHLHTSWSFDAFVFGNTLTGPEEAYQFAIGKPIRHPAGYMVQIKRPLDFQAVTDHSEYMGTIRLANDPQSDLSKLPIAEKLKVRSREDVQKVYLFLATSIITEPIKELVSPDVVSSVWKRVVEAADKYYQPGKFTTFAAYEWSSTPDNRNLHRNILFRDTKKVPALPFSSIDSNHPEDLWAWMDGQRKAGNEVLAISHNANLSDGVMFPLEVDSKGRPIDAAWAQSRVNNEPLSEIQQLKGASETHPALSPNDEFARHEILEYLLGEVDRAPRLHGSYIREGYENGLAMQDTRGYNPYKFGLVGASDTHGTAAAYAQSNYFGGHGLLDGTAQARISGVKTAGMTMDRLSTSGLGGVWAEENTREAIFAAMQRKETFGTSGVRIKVRFFGGWDFTPNVVQGKDWVKTGYASGVPMGSDLPAAKSKAPTFIVWAVKDPDEANLDRIQIVKGWTRNGQIFEKIYDVAWSNRKAKGGGPVSDVRVRSGQVELPPVGNTVDVKNASYTNTIGAVELKTVWTDPDFDPSQFAFYYARVLQIPTPRWTTYDAKKLGVPPPNSIPATVQDRAWTSPIWYSPSDEARKAAKPGTTVADLRQRGGAALDDSQLKQLIVGKTFKIRNTVTGQRFEILYGPDGRRLILSVDGKQPPAGEVSDVLHSGEVGSPAHYEIRAGKILTTIANTPFEITVYKVGDKYVAARSNEFGYANYEVEWAHVRSSVKRWLREPLLQFLVAGALLFAAYRALHPESFRPTDDNRIEVTADDIRQLEIAWTAQWRRPPTPDEMRGLVDARVREEILYRQALTLGLERGDAIVKRRLAQKMEFLASDVSALPDPTAAELRAWYASNAGHFAEPGRRSFRHVYFSTDRRGARAREDAASLLSQLFDKPADVPVADNAGDPFMFQNQYADRSSDQIASIFGSAFAAAVNDTRTASWQGPIESGLGWHLVFVTSVIPGRVPSYDEVEPQIKAAWLDEQRGAARQRAFEAMKAHYEIRLPEAARVAAAPGASAAKSTP